MKILINTPDINKLGGVANHYKGLKPYWSEDVHYNFIAGRKGIPGSVLLPFDLVIFFFKLLFWRYDVVILNPSLGKTALKRDALFLTIASWFNVKKIVFFHGWSEAVATDISKNSNWFLDRYKKADAFLVLASAFKNQLQSWGIIRSIYLTTTKVDNFLIKDFDVIEKYFNFNLFFLARIELYKGIFTAIEAFILLQQKHPELKFTIAGDGSYLQKAKELIKVKNIKNVIFLGNISGEILIKAFQKSDIYILPTDGEGMPTTVLEAMAFGLPIITRPVGGLNDFFQEKKMGTLIASKNAEDFAIAIEKLLNDRELLHNISHYNHNYAKQNFMASQVAKNLEAIFHRV